ncbi:MAG: hypothetical protein ACF8XB_10600, partial [Planctomycetota bacterium JB042]
MLTALPSCPAPFPVPSPPTPTTTSAPPEAEGIPTTTLVPSGIVTLLLPLNPQASRQSAAGAALAD